MIRTKTAFVTTLLLVAASSTVQMLAQSSILRVYADEQNKIHVVSEGSKDSVIDLETDEVGIDEVAVADDKQTAGWLVLYQERDDRGPIGLPFAGKLIVWRGGRIIRTFEADPTFWSWAFEQGATQIAYHVGPTHGETVSHCELHDVKTGRLLASWDGDLDDSARPSWTKRLGH